MHLSQRGGGGGPGQGGKADRRPGSCGYNESTAGGVSHGCPEGQTNRDGGVPNGQPPTLSRKVCTGARAR